MATPQISVLMPTRNAEAFVGEAVESILGQTVIDFELLVLDGGSTDRTLTILAGFGDPRLRVLAVPGAGIVAALNYGLEHARAPWVARQDADDISLPRRFELQLNALKGERGSIFCHTAVEFIGENSHSLKHARFPRSQALMALRLCWQCGIVHSTVMFSKESAVAVGGYRGSHAEDYDLWGRLIERGRFVGIPQKLVQFRLHPVSLSNRNLEPMMDLTRSIAVEHCRRFMNLSPTDAKRAHRALEGQDQSVRDWFWFLTQCAPRMRWKSLESCAWLGLQTFKRLWGIPRKQPVRLAFRPTQGEAER